MILKRYVQVENGMVYDMNQIGYVSVCFTNKGGSYNGVYTVGDDYKEGFPIIGWNSPITATADDVWELVKEGWITKSEILGIVRYMDYVTIGFKNDRMPKTINALYCPITENRKVVRYELIWERQ